MKSKIITGLRFVHGRGPRSIVASIGDCGSPDRGSIPLEGLHHLFNITPSILFQESGEIVLICERIEQNSRAPKKPTNYNKS